MKFNFRLIALFISLLAVSGTASATEPLRLNALRFLVGEWQADQPGGAKGGTTFSLSLQGHAIVRTNYAQYPASGNTPASRHDDLMIIYEVGESMRADYYDSEGHVIRYSLTSPAANQVVMISDIVTGEPRYRLEYKLRPNGMLSGEFALAPPNTPEQFKPYLSWESHRAQK